MNTFCSTLCYWLQILASLTLAGVALGANVGQYSARDSILSAVILTAIIITARLFSQYIKKRENKILA